MKQFLLEVLMGIAYATGGGLIWANKPFWVWIWFFIIAGILLSLVSDGIEREALLREARRRGKW